MRIAAAFIASTVLLTLGCTSVPASNIVAAYKPELTLSSKTRRVMLLGRWFGSAPLKEGGTREWIVERGPQGKYIVHFRVLRPDNSIEESTEVGEWGVSGPVYFTLMKGWIVSDDFQPANPADGYFSDAYEILSLDAESMTYRNYETGNVFTVRRFGEKADWPEK